MKAHRLFLSLIWSLLAGLALASTNQSKSLSNYEKVTSDRIEFYTKSIKEFQEIEKKVNAKGIAEGYRAHSEVLYHLKNLRDMEKQLRHQWEASRKALLKEDDDEKQEDYVDKQEDRFDQLSDQFFEEYENATNVVLKA
ncbi:hypothetical protein K493DRAFT_385255 [Basidiobolus meristosporus CBS 931.73]|uniref:Uncharacterized protein n=1 Tax=Basidiobolus meristosporus CBS 931.73 TaxID=1314790 RepID=A0A1Y1YXR9_9FUNG|nr:hypothetical protein K493DRAFT_385255 [Basidiobolus meristosporus CBS 931.73]|eukprot:ORY02821.1 hypothetical protein K493DRAFT_385255 [Basidiobolus meristosporus CBS 931.73]